MARPFDFGEIKLTAGGDDSSALPAEDTPFRIAVLGDFSGRSEPKPHRNQLREPPPGVSRPRQL